MPRQIKPRWPVFLWANPVFPIVGRHKVTARIATDRGINFFHQIYHILPHAVGVGGRVIWLIYAGINRTAKMLEERAIKAFIYF